MPFMIQNGRLYDAATRMWVQDPDLNGKFNEAEAAKKLNDMLNPPSYTQRVFLGTFNVTQTATVLISAGIRNVTVTGVTGLKADDIAYLFPVAVMPTGYSLSLPVVVADETLSVPVNGPALAIGANYSIPCRVFVLR